MNRTERQERERRVPSYANRRELDDRIAQIGARQKQLVMLEQFTDLGMSRRGVARRASQRRLFRVHNSVFCLHPPPCSRHQEYLAAVYVCGRGTFISDEAAGWLLGGIESPPSAPIVTNRTRAGRENEAFEVHRRDVEPRDVFKWHGIPCTRPERTVLDCAASASIEQLEELLMALDSKEPRIDRHRLDALVAQSSGRQGIRNLRFLITDDPKETDSVNERRMLRICRRHGVPDPETQYEIRAAGKTYRADFCWPELRLVVECDSWRWHGGKLKTEDDTARDQDLAIAGWIVVHFTRNQIKLDPVGTGLKLVALTSR